MTTTLQASLAERFFSHVERDGEHLIWIGSHNSSGYPTFRVGARVRLAHHVSLELLLGGEIPGILDVDHVCRVKSCVAPWHLEAVTRAENLRRAYAVVPHPMSRRTHCPAGHEYNGENTLRSGGRRRCRACRRLQYLRRRLQEVAA